MSALRPLPESRPFVARYLVRRKPGLSFEQYRRHQLEVHVPLALKLPGLLDYRIHFFEEHGGEPQPYDALVEVAFRSPEEMEAAMASPEGEAARADIPLCADPDALVVLTAGPEHSLGHTLAS